jgi:hypothetical protein
MNRAIPVSGPGLARISELIQSSKVSSYVRQTQRVEILKPELLA